MWTEALRRSFVMRGFEKRGVEEPQSEVVIRGPREGFSEVLRVNTSLLRRRIRIRAWIENSLLGESVALKSQSSTSKA